MKGKLIYLNWLFAWALLCYNGDSPIIAALVVTYFGFASWLLTKHKKVVDKELRRLENWIDKLITR